MRKNEIYRQAIKELAKVGVRPAVHWGGKHPILSWVGKDGRVYSMPFPSTPGDFRSIRNHKSHLRRKMRDGGLLTA